MSETIASPWNSVEGAEGTEESSFAEIGSYADWGTRPATEVSEKPQRRSLEGADNLRILVEAERSKGRGKLGELLRREGLHSSHLFQRPSHA